jgi:hypothetical protein
MNAIVFAPRTSPEIAARELCAVMLSRGDTPMPDPAALADALTRAACRAAEYLIDNAGALYAGSLPMTATDRDALRTLIAEARTNLPAPRLPTLRERRNAARTLAQEHGTRVQAWMLWNGWTHAIGCGTCRELGPAATCWGAIGCHGFLSGCGCAQCGGGR